MSGSLVDRWEAAALDRAVTHLEHVESAWALVRVAAGKPERFDEALTRGWAAAVADSAARDQPTGFEAFLAAHSQLRRGDLLGRPAWQAAAATLSPMFTGIVREQGRVAQLDGDDEGVRLRVEAPGSAVGLRVGDSVSVNGACLTATAVEAAALTFHAVPETLRRTSLGRLNAGDAVNVEPALRAGEPLGGHYVQGHVDAVGRVRSVQREGEGVRMWIDAPPEVLRYCVEKGSVAVEGVSLTVTELGPDGFAVALVPHTLQATTLGALGPGDEVNLETDVLAKYVERLLPR